MTFFSTLHIPFTPAIKDFLRLFKKQNNTVAGSRKCFCRLCTILHKIMLQQTPYQSRSIEAPVISYSLLNTENPLWKHKPKAALHRLPWNQCTLLRKAISCPQTQNTDQPLKVSILVTCQFSNPLSTGHCSKSILQIACNLQTTKLCASRKPSWCMFLLRLQKDIRTNTGGKGRWKAQGMNDQNQVNKHKHFTEQERNFIVRQQSECVIYPCGDI